MNIAFIICASASPLLRTVVLKSITASSSSLMAIHPSLQLSVTHMSLSCGNGDKSGTTLFALLLRCPRLHTLWLSNPSMNHVQTMAGASAASTGISPLVYATLLSQVSSSRGDCGFGSHSMSYPTPLPPIIHNTCIPCLYLSFLLCSNHPFVPRCFNVRWILPHNVLTRKQYRCTHSYPYCV